MNSLYSSPSFKQERNRAANENQRRGDADLPVLKVDVSVHGTILPLSMKIFRVATRSPCSTSWETQTSARLPGDSSIQSTSNSSTADEVFGSSAAVGSSKSRICGVKLQRPKQGDHLHFAAGEIRHRLFEERFLPSQPGEAFENPRPVEFFRAMNLQGERPPQGSLRPWRRSSPAAGGNR